MIHTRQQGSEEWKAVRIGKVTASRVIDILPGKTGYKASRKNYLAELICEILTGEQAESFCSTAMQWGTDHEPEARAVYEAETGNMVQEVGFCDHPSIPGFGASPDGLMEDSGLEIKCPNTATHIDTVLNGTIDYKYIVQMQVNMMCAERKKWVFVSYDPRLPDVFAFYRKEIPEDKSLQATIEHEVEKFTLELKKTLEALKLMKGVK